MGTFLRIFAFSFCLMLCFYYLDASYFLMWPFNQWTREEIGQFGDSWGFVTSIFSVVAFFGVLFSLGLQRKSLEHSEELTKRQTEAFGLQAFEGNFFQMLNILQNIIQDMDLKSVKTNDVLYSGRDVFISIYDKKFKLLCKGDSWEDIDHADMLSILKERFDEIFKQRQQELGHYFRFLYNIFKYIDDSGISKQKKDFYSRVVRAQLSNYELYILFYNCFSTYGESFRKYVIRFELFDNLHVPGLLSKKHINLIDRKAYGKNPDINDIFFIDVTCHKETKS